MKQEIENKPFLIMDEVRNRIDIHPEFRVVFDFLIQIETEVKELMSFQEKLKNIKKQCVEIFDVLLKMNLDERAPIKVSDDPRNLADKFHFIRPVRAEFIVLFAHLETLRCLYIAYKEKTSESSELRDASDEAMDNFIKDFCLCIENEWISKNPKRAGKISADNLRKLRNSLTHFFSVDKIGLVPLYDDEIQKLTNKTNHKAQFLSPEDFEKILSSAAKLLLRKWSDDCKMCIENGSNEFIERMRCVKKVVEKNGAVFIRENNISKK